MKYTTTPDSPAGLDLANRLQDGESITNLALPELDLLALYAVPQLADNMARRTAYMGRSRRQRESIVTDALEEKMRKWEEKKP